MLLVFGLETEDSRDFLKNLYDEELHNLFSLPDNTYGSDEKYTQSFFFWKSKAK